MDLERAELSGVLLARRPRADLCPASATPVMVASNADRFANGDRRSRSRNGDREVPQPQDARRNAAACWRFAGTAHPSLRPVSLPGGRSVTGSMRTCPPAGTPDAVAFADPDHDGAPGGATDMCRVSSQADWTARPVSLRARRSRLRSRQPLVERRRSRRATAWSSTSSPDAALTRSSAN